MLSWSTVRVMVYDWVPSVGLGGAAMSSSTPVRVTGWAVCHSAAAKVRVAGATVPSVVSELARVRATVPAGSVASRTVKMAMPPDSVVRRPADGVSVRPGVGVTGAAPVTNSPLPACAAARTRTVRARGVAKAAPA